MHPAKTNHALDSEKGSKRERERERQAQPISSPSSFRPLMTVKRARKNDRAKRTRVTFSAMRLPKKKETITPYEPPQVFAAQEMDYVPRIQSYQTFV